MLHLKKSLGVTSEEGLILSAPFHKSPKRWNLLFQQWETWAPQLLFNRETDLITNEDREFVNKVRERFFGPSDLIPGKEIFIMEIF